MVLATSARDAAPLLAAAGLEDVFDHISDGQTALDRGVAGKPAPGDIAPVRVGTRQVLLRAGREHEFLLTDG